MSADPKAPEPGRAPTDDQMAAALVWLDENRLSTKHNAAPLAGLLALREQIAFEAGRRGWSEIAGEAVNAEPPATPEPAAPIHPAHVPRVSPESQLPWPEIWSWCVREGRARECTPEILLFFALRERADAAESRYVRDFVNWDARVQNARQERDEARAALARANEALREIAAYEPIGEPEAELATVHDAIVQIARDALAGAQGSAAQKPEPR